MSGKHVHPKMREGTQLPGERALVARQAILTRTRAVWAYQLLFRRSNAAKADIRDPDEATATVLMNTFVEIGLEQVVGDNSVVIEFPRAVLLEDFASIVPSKRLILQIPADTTTDAQMVGALRFLRSRGFRVAISSLLGDDKIAGWLDVADLVKFDVSLCKPESLKPLITKIQRRGLKMIASKVETYSEYESCARLGFDYFQGFFLERPQLVEGKKAPARAQQLLELLRVLNDPATTLDEIERLAVADVTFSYRLLKLLNSAAFGLRQRVESVRQAIVMLGMENLRKWTLVLSVSSQSSKPTELMRIAVIRAQMCENLGRALQQANLRMYFTVGFFSILDALLDRPLDQVLNELPLVPEVAEAVLQRAGVAGKVLSCVIAYERGDWDGARLKALGDAEIASAWFHAVQHADRMMAEAIG